MAATSILKPPKKKEQASSNRRAAEEEGDGETKERREFLPSSYEGVAKSSGKKG